MCQRQSHMGRCKWVMRSLCSSSPHVSVSTCPCVRESYSEPKREGCERVSLSLLI